MIIEQQNKISFLFIKKVIVECLINIFNVLDFVTRMFPKITLSKYIATEKFLVNLCVNVKR